MGLLAQPVGLDLVGPRAGLPQTMQPSVRDCPLLPRSPPADAAYTVHALWDWGAPPAAERGDLGQAGNQQPAFPVVSTPADVLNRIPALLLLPWTAPKKKKVSPMRAFSTQGGSVLVWIQVNSLTHFPGQTGLDVDVIGAAIRR